MRAFYCISIMLLMCGPAGALPPGPFQAELEITSWSITPTYVTCTGLVTNSQASIYTVTEYVLSAVEVYWGTGGQQIYNGLPYYSSHGTGIAPGGTVQISDTGSLSAPVDLPQPSMLIFEFYLVGYQWSNPYLQPATSIFVADGIMTPEPCSVFALLVGLGCVACRRTWR